MKAHICMCGVTAGEVNEGISWVHDGRGEAFIFFYCNSVMKLDSVRVIISQRGRDRCVLYGSRADRGRLVLPFVFLRDWLNVTLTSSLHPKNKKKKGWKARRASGQGFPQPPSLISFTASSSDRRQKQTESNLEKMRESRRKKRKKGGESGDKGWSQEADSCGSDNGAAALLALM